MQGGISAKTFWLYNSLKKNNCHFRIVTYCDEYYSTPKNSSNQPDVIAIDCRPIPWHIPETRLIDERLCYHAIQLSKNNMPDVVETNYLWPFCKDALLIANILKKPLIIRHAGSDILKFKNDPEFLNIIRWYFNQASAIATNHNAYDFVRRFTELPEKIRCLDRYIPDPHIFKPSKAAKSYDLLFAGKINYHWNLKGLELLMDVIKRKKLRSRFIIGGKYEKELLALISSYRIESYIDISGFIPCEQMPAVYNASRFVWCWEEKETLDDFSNVIWESLFSNIPCILNAETCEKIKVEGITEDFSELIYRLDRNSLKNFDFVHQNKGICVDWNQKFNMYKAYISSNMELYQISGSGT